MTDERIVRVKNHRSGSSWLAQPCIEKSYRLFFAAFSELLRVVYLANQRRGKNAAGRIPTRTGENPTA
jgi:hypothetical protein